MEDGSRSFVGGFVVWRFLSGDPNAPSSPLQGGLTSVSTARFLSGASSTWGSEWRWARLGPRGGGMPSTTRSYLRFLAKGWVWASWLRRGGRAAVIPFLERLDGGWSGLRLSAVCSRTSWPVVDVASGE